MSNTMRHTIIAVLCAALTTSGCATTDRAVMAEYVQKLQTGATVKVERSQRRSVRGVLMKATDHVVVIQPRTRLPEPAIEIPLDDVLAVTLESKSANPIGRSIAVGAAAGAVVILTMFLISAALWAD